MYKQTALVGFCVRKDHLVLEGLQQPNNNDLQSMPINNNNNNNQQLFRIQNLPAFGREFHNSQMQITRNILNEEASKAKDEKQDKKNRTRDRKKAIVVAGPKIKKQKLNF